MPTSLANSKLTLHESLLDLLWQQWSALGVAGTVKAQPCWSVDIEALLLITTSQGRAAPRLFDEMLDWLWSHAQWVNVQRLRNIHKALSLGDPQVLAAIAEWLSQRSVASKWKPLAALSNSSETAQVAPLFSIGGIPQPLFGEADPIFLRHGLHRGPIRRRQLSQSPNPRSPAALAWKLRALFGVQARSEILLWLLCNGSGHAAEISRATYFFPRTVDETLKELAASDLVRTSRTGRERLYWLNPDEWTLLRSWDLPAGFPKWVDWPRFFVVQERILRVLDTTGLSPQLQASELRRVFDELQPVLNEGGLHPFFTASRNHTGVTFTEVLVNDLLGVLAVK